MHARRLVVAVLCVVFRRVAALRPTNARAKARRDAAAHHPTTTTVPPTTTTTGPPFLYQVKAGDSLSALAGKFRVAVSVIMARNHLTNADVLHDGQVLHIPSAPALALLIKPAQGRAGQAFRFALVGAVPSETITFTVVSPTGQDVGGPHTTSDGTVNATYQTSVGDPAGLRTVLAVGDMGTRVTGHFIVSR